MVESIEGYNKGVTGYQEYNASFYTKVTASTSWTEIQFSDFEGNKFDSKHIRIKVTGGDKVKISLDPRNVATSARVVHGVFDASEVFFFHSKHATKIYVMRAGVADSDVEIMAWR